MRPFNAFYGALQNIINPWIQRYFYNALYIKIKTYSPQTFELWTKGYIYIDWFKDIFIMISLL